MGSILSVFVVTAFYRSLLFFFILIIMISIGEIRGFRKKAAFFQKIGNDIFLKRWGGALWF